MSLPLRVEHHTPKDSAYAGGLNTSLGKKGDPEFTKGSLFFFPVH